MDIEAKRIDMRVKLPYIPVTGTLCHRLPKTVNGDGRMVGCISGYALSVLGLTQEQLASQKNPDEAMTAAGTRNVPHGLFTEVAKLHDKKRVKEATLALKAEVAANRTFLRNAFGWNKVSNLEAAIEGILASYAKKDAPKPAPAKSVYRR